MTASLPRLPAFTSATLLVLGSLATPAVLAAPAPAVVDTRQVTAFRTVEVSGPFDVVVDAQGPRGLRLTGPAGELAEIETTVENDTLVIRSRQRKGWHFSFGKRHEPVTIHVGAPQLAGLKNSGSGDVQLQHVQAETFQLTSSGPGDTRADGSARELVLRVSGSGDVDLRQLRPATLRANLSGPGNVEAAGVTRELHVEQTGSGDLDVQDLRSDLVNATMRGPGAIALQGRSREIRAIVAGSGDLDACPLAVESVNATLTGPGDACVAGPIRQLKAVVHGSGDLVARDLHADHLGLVISGPGSVTLSGSTANLDAQLTGSGDLDGRSLQAGQANVTVRGPGTATVNVRGKLETQARQSSGNGQPRLVVVDRRGTHDGND